MADQDGLDLDWLDGLVEDAVRSEQPLPSELVEAAAGLHDFIGFDVNIAEIVEVELAVRSTSTRSRTFTWSNGYELILESVPGSEHSQLTGVVTPVQIDEILVRSLEGPIERVALEAGTFEWIGVSQTLRLELADGSYVTPWFRP